MRHQTATNPVKPHLLLEYVPLEGAEELFGLGQRKPKMLDALVVLGERDDIGDGLFVTVIVRDDELQFDGYPFNAGQLGYDCRYSKTPRMPVTGGHNLRRLKPLWHLVS